MADQSFSGYTTPSAPPAQPSQPPSGSFAGYLDAPPKPKTPDSSFSGYQADPYKGPTGIGFADTQDSTDFGKRVTPNLRSAVEQFAPKYQLTETSLMHGGHAENSAHYSGNAMDVGAVDGVTIGDNPRSREFLMEALGSGRFQKVGTTAILAKDPGMQQLARKAGTELFVDEGSGPHIHLQTGELPQGGMKQELAQQPGQPHEAQAGLGGVLGAVPQAPQWKQGLEDKIGAAKSAAFDWASGIVNSAWEHVVLDSSHAVEQFGKIESTPQRALLSTYLHAGEGLHMSTLQKVVADTTDLEKTQELTNDLEHRLATQMHLPDFSNAQGWEKVVADIVVGTATDPLTYVPIADVAVGLSRGAKILQHVSLDTAAGKEAVKFIQDAIGNHENLKQMLESLGNFYKAGKDVSTKFSTGVQAQYKHIFVDRLPHLTGVLDDNGKAAYVGLDSATDLEMTKYARYRSEQFDREYGSLHKAAPNQPTASVRQAWLQDMYRYGGTRGRAMAATNHFIPDVMDQRYARAAQFLDFNAKGAPDFSKLRPRGPQGWMLKTDLEKTFEHYDNPKNAYEYATARAELTRMAVQRKMLANGVANWALKGQAPGRVRGFATQVPKLGRGSVRDWVEKQLYPRGQRKIAPAERDLYTGLRKLARVWKTGIMLNFAPHGLMNMFSMTMMRGGFTTAARGLGYGMALFKNVGLKAAGTPAVGGKGLDDLVMRLTRAGGLTSFWRSPEGLGLVGKIGFGNFRPMRSAINAASEILDHLETGYRASYLEFLDTLDGTRGVPYAERNFDQELQKMARVQNDIADYKHMTLFIQALHTMGGVFAQFHGDIAVRGAWNEMSRAGLFARDPSMRHLPLTSLMGRAQTAINETPGTGVPAGTEMEFGGPATAGMHAAYDPSYWLAQSAIGPVGSTLVHRGAEALTHDPQAIDLGQDAQGTATSYIPGYRDITNIPGLEDLSQYPLDPDTPWWMRGWFMMLGGYERTEGSAKTDVRRHKQFERYEP